MTLITDQNLVAAIQDIAREIVEEMMAPKNAVAVLHEPTTAAMRVHEAYCHMIGLSPEEHTWRKGFLAVVDKYMHGPEVLKLLKDVRDKISTYGSQSYDAQQLLNKLEHPND